MAKQNDFNILDFDQKETSNKVAALQGGTDENFVAEKIGNKKPGILEENDGRHSLKAL